MFSQISTTPHNRDTNKKLVKIIHILLEDPESVSFRKPVPHKALGLGDYKKIIKKPIDLNQIRRQNNEFKYKTIEQALDDIQLCWDNCKLYNDAGSKVYHQAQALQKSFWKLVQDNFPQIHTQIEGKLKELQSLEIYKDIAIEDQGELSESVGSGRDQQDDWDKGERVDKMESELVSQQQEYESQNSRIDEEVPPQGPKIPEEQKEVILVNLKQSPSESQLLRLSQHMKTIEDKSMLEQVLEVLFSFEKQRMVGVGKGQMGFSINQIHISTYYRICKIVKFQVDDIVPIIQ